jgi:hypothetical protein
MDEERSEVGESEDTETDDSDYDMDDDNEDQLFDDQTIPPELDQIKRSMQSDYTKKTQRLAEERRAMEAEQTILRKKAEAFDKLVSNQKSTDSQREEDEDDSYFDQYGDNAPAMKGFVDAITKKVVSNIKKEMEPLTRSATDNLRDREMNSLQAWVTSESKRTGLNLPSPLDYATEIRSLMEAGVPANQAYQASISLSKLSTRATPDKKKGIRPGPPGSSNSSSIPKKKGYSMEDVIAMKKKGEKLPDIDALIEMANKGEL